MTTGVYGMRHVSIGGFFTFALLCAGAPVFSDHWAFQPPVCPPLPEVRRAAWPRNPIDTLILSRLEQEGLPPSPEADKPKLIRRLSLDLTGLPPTIAEVDAFVADPSPDAYEKLAERLLAAPSFGERWAIRWLDAARYADTNGYEIDRPRSIWAYRDWVIDALNFDMPFDRFTIEQVAGDLLPGATLSQRVATGFHRNTWINEEGGHDWEQFRYESIVDRVATTGTVFLGLTVACAQCHDHKYDPISQKEYWQLFAFFNNADEPFLEVPEAAVMERQREIDAEIARLEAGLESRFPTGEERDRDAPAGVAGDSKPAEQRRQSRLSAQFERWLEAEARRATSWQTLRPLRFTSQNNATISRLDDDSLLVTGDRPELDTYTVEFHTELASINGFRLEALPHPRLPHHGPGRGSVLGDGAFALTEFSVVASPLANQSLTRGDAAEESNNALAVEFEKATATTHRAKRTVDLAIDGDKHTSWHIRGVPEKMVVAVFEPSEPFGFEGGTRLTVTLMHNFVHQQSLGRFRILATRDETPSAATIRPTRIDDLLVRSPASWSDAERRELKRYYLSVAPELASEHEKIEQLRSRRPNLPTTMVLEERQERRKTHLHIRGEYRRPDEEVTPAVPGVLHPLPEGEPPDRLTLARWIASDRNPLTARVIMNQLWQAYFGRALVNTPEDFGTQGESPSHPALLDWLATEFRRQGWSLKAMHRLIVNSATYRQSSTRSPQLLAKDPGNILLARGPRFRIEAEMVRDLALSVSGLLETELGGPSVFPPQPSGTGDLAYGGGSWKVSSGADRFRRGLYTHLKRASPYPMFMTFDAPAPSTCTVRRTQSNTPLQALTLLNDSAFVEAAQALAARVIAEAPEDIASRARFAFRLCLARAPRDAELKVLTDFYGKQRARFEKGTADPGAVAGVDANTPDAARVKELAAWTTVARLLLNLDETITKE